MDGSVREDRVELGVLFVHGIGQQRPGRTVASFAAALYGWLFRWNYNKQRPAGWPATGGALLMTTSTAVPAGGCLPVRRGR